MCGRFVVVQMNNGQGVPLDLKEVKAFGGSTGIISNAFGPTEPNQSRKVRELVLIPLFKLT